MKTQPLEKNGDPKPAGIASQPGTQSLPVKGINTSDILDSIPPQNPTFQATADYRATDEETYIRTIEMFGAKLITLGLAEWRNITLLDGRKGFAFFLDRDIWDQDPEKKSLVRKAVKK